LTDGGRPPLFGSPLPDPWRRERRRRVFEHPLLHLLLFIATFVTTTLAGGLAFTVSGGPLRGGRFSDGLPFSIPLLVILGVHEMGHYLMCRRYALAATLPYFLPSPFLNLIGTFGALIRIKEPIRGKRALLDIGAAGPLAGFLAAIPFLLYGVALPRRSTAPLVPGTVLFDYPLLVRLAQDLTGVGRYASTTVHEHPTFMAAWFGLLVTALNLLPIGQLDGGHVLRAVAGRRQPLLSGVVLLLALASALRGSAVWAVFGLFVAVVMGIAHPPVEDEEEELDPKRVLVALLCLAVFLLCFSLVPIQII
jgi:membrane-associated protease RseP (regulator of RpoE activity)